MGEFVTGVCNHCSGKIEFEQESYDPENPPTVACPHCGSETRLYPLSPEPAPPVIAEPPRVSFGDKDSVVEIRLTSGMEVKIKAIQLYNELRLEEMRAKKSSAM